MNEADRRIHKRFDVSFPLHVRVKTESPPIETATTDMSARGLCFRMAGDIELGTELEFEITLPPELGQGKAVLLRCRGRIVRVERREGEPSVGVGATIEDYEFVSKN